MASVTTALDVLVSTDWVAQHRADAGVRVVEVDVDTAAYDQGHVPGALGWNWTTDLCDTVVRDIVPKAKLETLLGASGITPIRAIVHALGRNIPAILVTGDTSAATAGHARQHGYPLLHKPIDPAALRLLVERATHSPAST